MVFQTRRLLPAILISLLFGMGLVMGLAADSIETAFLPAILGGRASVEEVRALWITRFDWTSANGADPAKIDEIVNNAAAAGFNVLYFQVRGEADAYYASDLEPWSKRLSGSLGKDPGWDPLQRIIERAHDSGLQVHAYINVYPLWTGCEPPAKDTSPRHLYYDLLEIHGETDGKLNGVQWDDRGKPICQPYYRVSPASVPFDDHLKAVVRNLVQNYDLDGIHLDHIRYAGKNSSCDPITEERFGAACFNDALFADWQRNQVNSTVQKLFDELRSLDSTLWLTAAVWPVYRDIYGWNVSSGYDTYYQDPKAWLTAAYIDGISPMIYTGEPNCDKPYFWTRDRWAQLVADYQADREGRYIIPGLGVNYCTGDDFAEIEARIELARNAGTAGHAIFSYSGLLTRAYFDDLAAGPYASPARVPPLPAIKMP